MAFVDSTNALFLSLLLLCSSITVYADKLSPAYPPHSHGHYDHAPTPAPSQPLIKPPPTPSYPPVIRKLVAIRGMVFCNFCNYRGFDTLNNVLPLAGAVLKLQCNNTKIPLVEQTEADAKGFFFFMPQKLSTFAWHKCKVSLVSTPLAWCGVPSNQNGGAAGATLIPTPLPPVNQTESKFMLFTVGPFAFEPPKKFPCH